MSDQPQQRNDKSPVNFETIKMEELKFGANNFVEVSRKKAITKDGENVFINITRGFYLQDGKTKRYKRSVAVPDEEEIKKFISEQVLQV